MYNKSTGKKIALLSELQTKEDKPNDLKLSIKTLEKSNLTLSVENAKLKTELIRYQVENQSLVKLKDVIEQKNTELDKLKQSYKVLENEYKDYKFTSSNKYEKDVQFIKLQNENNNFKWENANKIETCNNTLYYKIIELENIINNFSKEEKKKIRALEVENSNKMAAFRKKMLDFLKNEHSDFGSNSNKQSELNSKLLSSEITKVKLSKVKPKLYLGNKNSIGLTATLTDQYNSKIALRKSLINESNSTLNSSERLSYRNRDNIAKTQTLSDFSYQIKKKKLRIEDSKLLLDTISILQ